jgi:hypothetical protein
MKNNKINMCYYAHLYGIAYSVSIMWYEMGYSVIYRWVIGASWNKGGIWFFQQHLNQDRSPVLHCVYTPANLWNSSELN